MNVDELAREVAALVVRDTQFWIAVVGLIGVIVGALLTLAGNIVLHRMQNERQRALDETREKILKTMLEQKEWRRLSTLSRVIGCEPEEARRLLIHLGARGSETKREDGEELWGLIAKHPLEKIDP
jgi:hypothetical protein